ncbi:MAG: hypothetical protein FWD65_02270 [Coriobacteriia bacterium]|nr:hypothetical protein [Coriobacteriia bacterium]
MNALSPRAKNIVIGVIVGVVLVVGVQMVIRQISRSKTASDSSVITDTNPSYRKPADIGAEISQARDRASAARTKLASDTAAGLQVSRENTDYKAANKLFRQGKYSEALDKYQQVLKEEPYHADALNNAALACLELKNNLQALRYSLTAVALYPKYSELNLNLEAACVAAGYDLSSLAYSIDGYTAISVSDLKSTDFMDADIYNSVYADIWRDELFSPTWDDTGSSSSFNSRENHYEDQMGRLKSLKKDPDVDALRAYFQRQGVLAGVVSKPKTGK